MSAITARVREVGSDVGNLGKPPEGYLWVCIEVAHADSSRCHGEYVILDSYEGFAAARASLFAAREHEAQARATAAEAIADRERADRRTAAAADVLVRSLVDASTSLVLQEVAVERVAQDRRWGEQNHPSFNPAKAYDVIREDDAKRICDSRAADGSIAYADILLEEVAEVFGTNAGSICPDETKTRAELVQVCAVSEAWIEAIDRRAGEVTQ